MAVNLFLSDLDIFNGLGIIVFMLFQKLIDKEPKVSYNNPVQFPQRSVSLAQS
jgi:hypothetical protein